jgi:hypothetical protein
VYSYGSSFVCPPLDVLVVAGPEEAKNLSGGRNPPPDSDPFDMCLSLRKLCTSCLVRRWLILL